MLSQLDVFTVDEIARAAGVPRAAVQRLVDSGELTSVAASGFFDTQTAVMAGTKARRDAAADVASSLASASTTSRHTNASSSWQGPVPVAAVEVVAAPLEPRSLESSGPAPSPRNRSNPRLSRFRQEP